MFAFCALYWGGDEEVNARDTLGVICSTALAVLEVGGRRSVSSAVTVGRGSAAVDVVESGMCQLSTGKALR